MPRTSGAANHDDPLIPFDTRIRWLWHSHVTPESEGFRARRQYGHLLRSLPKVKAGAFAPALGLIVRRDRRPDVSRDAGHPASECLHRAVA